MARQISASLRAPFSGLQGKTRSAPGHFPGHPWRRDGRVDRRKRLGEKYAGPGVAPIAATQRRGGARGNPFSGQKSPATNGTPASRDSRERNKRSPAKPAHLAESRSAHRNAASRSVARARHGKQRGMRRSSAVRIEKRLPAARSRVFEEAPFTVERRPGAARDYRHGRTA